MGVLMLVFELSPPECEFYANVGLFQGYKPVILTCPLPDDRKPLHVSIVDMKQPELPPLNCVRVSYNSLSKHRERNFTMCLSPLHGQSATPLDFIQYFELNRMLGAEYFIVYNHSLSDPKNDAILHHYRRIGLAEIVQWRLPPMVEAPEGVWYQAQLTMLNDCIYRNKGVSKFVLTTDTDEFILPLYVFDWKELLFTQPKSCEYNFRSVALRQKSSSADTEKEVSTDERTKKMAISTLLNTERRKYIFPKNSRSKYIVRPDCVDVAGVHYLEEVSPGQNEELVTRVAINKGLTYHYAGKRRFTQIGPGFLDKAITKYHQELVKRVQAVRNNISRLLNVAIRTY